MNGSCVIDPDDPRWPEAEHRDMVLRSLLKASWGKVTGEIVKAAGEQLGISRSRPFRLVARFRQTERHSLLPLLTRSGSVAGASSQTPRRAPALEMESTAPPASRSPRLRALA
jgi:hypothetical protein